ncbi:MAG TPA: PIG-L family deacetylase [Pirellulales bacterium]|nr:PIG-L family deacetylase [Pirellulales bacterium]
MPQHTPDLERREFLTRLFAGVALSQAPRLLSNVQAETAADVVFERPAAGKPHQGKVLLAVQAHSDDIPLMAAGTVAKLVKEGYTGYLVRATNDDMGDAPGLGTPGSIGDHVLGNERDNAEVARALGLKKAFDLNYPNHRMGDVPQNELQCRLIFLIRNYIKEFVLGRSRALGKKYGVEYAEAFHYLGGPTPKRTAVEEYIEKNAVPNK